jgi:hypothetical protein
MFDSVQSEKPKPPVFWANLAGAIGSTIAIFAMPEYPRVVWVARFASIFFGALFIAIAVQRRRADLPKINGQ